jgi:hypothetical protein
MNLLERATKGTAEWFDRKRQRQTLGKIKIGANDIQHHTTSDRWTSESEKYGKKWQLEPKNLLINTPGRAGLRGHQGAGQQQ